jgi:hypothetical protein
VDASAGEYAAALTAAAALVGSVVALIHEIRLMREDIVTAVAQHKDETIRVLEAQQHQ